MDCHAEICRAIDMMADGNESAAQGILNHCITHLKEIYRAGGLTADQSYCWGMCYHLMEEHDQALLKFEEALKSDPEHENSLWQIVQILFYTKQQADLARSLLENKLLKMNAEKREYLDFKRDIESFLRHEPPSEAGPAQTPDDVNGSSTLPPAAH